MTRLSAAVQRILDHSRRPVGRNLPGIIRLVSGDPDVATPEYIRRALADAILATVDPGDRVLLPEPTYSLYTDLIRYVDAEPVLVPQTDALLSPDEAADSLPRPQALTGTTGGRGGDQAFH